MITLTAQSAGSTNLDLQNAVVVNTEAVTQPVTVEDGTLMVIQPATEYWFPWYDQVGMSTWVLVGNPSETETAEVHIYVGDMSTPKSSHSIPPGGRVTPQYGGLMDGPVKVVSTNGVKVLTSVPSLYEDSFNEVMGEVIP